MRAAGTPPAGARPHDAGVSVGARGPGTARGGGKLPGPRDSRLPDRHTRDRGRPGRAADGPRPPGTGVPEPADGDRRVPAGGDAVVAGLTGSRPHWTTRVRSRTTRVLRRTTR